MSITIKESNVTYGPNIVTDGLVLYLDAGNPESYPGSGTIWYDLIGDNNGTLINESIGTTNPNYMTFESNNYDYITLTSRLFLKESASFSVWVISNGDYTLNYGSRGQIIGHNSPYSNELCFNDNGSSYRIEGETSTNGNYYSVTGYDYDDEWLNIHVNFFESTGYTYVNGYLVNSRAMLNNLSLYRIGGNVDSTPEKRQLLNGKIPMIMYYNQHLSSTQILRNFNSTKSRFGY